MKEGVGSLVIPRPQRAIPKVAFRHVKQIQRGDGDNANGQCTLKVALVVQSGEERREVQVFPIHCFSERG